MLLSPTPEELKRYDDVFSNVKDQPDALTGGAAKDKWAQFGLPGEKLLKIWSLADVKQCGKLNIVEHRIAMHLIGAARTGAALPASLPPSLLQACTHGSTGSAQQQDAASLAMPNNFDAASISTTPATAAMPVMPTTAAPATTPEDMRWTISDADLKLYKQMWVAAMLPRPARSALRGACSAAPDCRRPRSWRSGSCPIWTATIFSCSTNTRSRVTSSRVTCSSSSPSPLRCRRRSSPPQRRCRLRLPPQHLPHPYPPRQHRRCHCPHKLRCWHPPWRPLRRCRPLRPLRLRRRPLHHRRLRRRRQRQVHRPIWWASRGAPSPRRLMASRRRYLRLRQYWVRGARPTNRSTRSSPRWANASAAPRLATSS